MFACILVATSLVLAGCGGDEKSDDGGDEPAVESTKAPDVPDTWPLTGLEVPGGKSAALTHPVLVLKMDNTSSSAPQVGLGKADLVVEELVEGGVCLLYTSDAADE